MALITLGANGLGAGVGGNFVLLNTSSSATDVSSFDFDSTYINSTYDNYFVLGNIQPQSNGIFMNLRFSANGTLETGGSDYTYEIQNIAGATEESSTVSLIKMTREALSSSHNFNFQFFVFNTQNANERSTIHGQGSGQPQSGTYVSPLFGGQRQADKVNDGFSILPSSGNLQGTVSLYGVKQ